MNFMTASPDVSHVVFETPFSLTTNAHTILESWCEEWCGLPNLYEWAKGRLELVNELPGGGTTSVNANGITAHVAIAGGGLLFGMAARTISADGRWVAWTWGVPYGPEASDYRGLFLRDTVAERTYQLGGHGALYQTMSSDGSEVFYLEGRNLYAFNTATQTQTDLTPSHGAEEENAGVKEAVSDVSEDGASVYFVATGVLAEGAVHGQPNLYLLRDSNGSWGTRYIATLSRQDEKDWYEEEFGGSQNAAGVSSRVSPDGRFLTFMSQMPLTGYDNIDANSGQPDEEVFLYDASTGHLACASCNPSGARPSGVLDAVGQRLLVDNQEFWGYKFRQGQHWLAGSIPGWTYRNNGRSLYQPRYLSDSGRLFFNSPDALVPQDTNGVEDVYEYEPTGVGDCTLTNPAFSPRSGGCVSLISSGTSSSESVFYDASESGDDVFFLTASRLTPADQDTAFDVYDAHVCSASVPCLSAAVSPPPCSSGDSCKAAPSPQPTIYGAPASATFNGTGNAASAPRHHFAPRCRSGQARRRGRCVKKHKARTTHCNKRRRGRHGACTKSTSAARPHASDHTSGRGLR